MRSIPALSWTRHLHVEVDEYFGENCFVHSVVFVH